MKVRADARSGNDKSTPLKWLLLRAIESRPPEAATITLSSKKKRIKLDDGPCRRLLLQSVNEGGPTGGVLAHHPFATRLREKTSHPGTTCLSMLAWLREQAIYVNRAH